MTDDRRPITPTRVIPASEPLPAPAAPPPPPPRPPAPPAVADADPLPDWWRTGSGPSGPPPPVPVDVHVTVAIDQPGYPIPLNPEPDPPWWRRIRWGYHLGMAVLAFPVSGPWAWVLNDVRHEKSLAGAWVMAAFVWALIAVWDNVCRIRALQAHPEAWLPKLRAFLARLLLYAAIIATFLTLPLTTLVYWITGVHSP